MTPLLLALAMTPSAEALTTRQSGPWIEAGVGFAAGDTPLAAGVGWQAGVGWWSGRYDDAFAIGRYWGAGLTLRQDWIDGELRTAPMLEVRRGVDLLVVGWHAFLGGGPLLTSGDGGDALAVEDSTLGATARGGVGVEWRRTPFLGLTLRLEGGADFVDGQVGAVAAALIGGQFSRPLKQRRP